MSRTRTFVQGAALSGASVFVSMAALLAVGKIFTNTLTVESVAIFGAIMAIADFLNIALSLGVYHGLPKLVAAAPPCDQGAYVRAALLGQTLIAAAFSVMFYLIWFLGSDLLSGMTTGYPLLQSVSPHLWLVPPLFFVGAIRETTMAALAGANRYGRRAVGISLAAIGQIVFVVVALLVMDLGVPGLVAALVLAHALAVVIMMAGLPWSVDKVGVRQAWNESVRFSWPLYANSLLNFSYARFDFFLVSALVGLPAAGVYDTVKRLPTMLSRVMNAMLVPYLPSTSELIASGDRESASNMMHHAIALTAFIGYTAAFGAVVVQEPLILLLFAEEYLTGAPVLGLLLVAIVLAVQAGIVGQSLIALGHPLAITIINVGLAVASVAANLLLLPRFGLIGAGYAALIAVSLSYTLQALAARHYGLAMQWTRLLRPQAVLVAAAAILWWGEGTILWRLAALAAFVSLSFLFGVITPRQLQEIVRALRPRRGGVE